MKEAVMNEDHLKGGKLPSNPIKEAASKAQNATDGARDTVCKTAKI